MPKTVAELEAELAEARAAERDARMRTIPADQRAAFQRQLEIEDRERNLEQRESALNARAKELAAQRISSETGMSVEDLMKAETPDAMNQLAYEYVRDQTSDPVKLRAFADMLEKVTGTTTDPAAQPAAAAPAAPAPAPGITTAPPQAGQPTAPANPNGAAASYIEANKGKGRDSIAGFLQTLDQAPASALPAGPVPAPSFQAPASPAGGESSQAQASQPAGATS